jgi:hypothetical protein
MAAARARSNSIVAAGALAFCLLSSGCALSPMSKHAAAFSAATSTIVDGSKDAYRGAMELRIKEQTVAAVYAYDKNPTWSPYKDFAPLLTPEQLQARITVLDGLKAYAGSLVELTTGKPTSDATDAAMAAGASLQGLNQSIATKFSTAMPNAPVMDQTATNGVSTAVLALQQYLAGRKVKGSLAKVTGDMNPNVQALCGALNKDIDVLRRQADVDYQSLVENQDQFIRHSTLDPLQHRAEVGKLVSIANQQKMNDDMLSGLQAALVKLVLTHQALAAAAQGNNPESLQQKIADLSAAGSDLKNYYKTLQATMVVTLTAN